jgi:hypothetical protein
MVMDPNSALHGIQDEPAANTDLSARLCSALHGWLSAGGRAPSWKKWPLGTARFLGHFPEHRRGVPDADKYRRAARIMLAHDADFADTDAGRLRPGDLSEAGAARYRTGDLTSEEVEREIDDLLLR